MSNTLKTYRFKLSNKKQPEATHTEVSVSKNEEDARARIEFHYPDSEIKSFTVSPYYGHETLTTVKDKTRLQIVPYYTDLLLRNASDAEVLRINNLILTKWKPTGLLYIKQKAWKEFYEDMENLETDELPF